MKITNAVILAAGRGERLKPLTDTTPKPLLKVNDIPLIELAINALKIKGIHDITIVTGYKSEQFDYLKSKYEVRLVYNKYWDKYNNIYSLYVAKKYLNCTLIMDGDQLITNIDIIQTDIDNSGYVCYKQTTPENEWTLTLDNDNYIIDASAKNNLDYILRSMSFWMPEDTAQFKTLLTRDFVKRYQDNYWDNVAMFICPNRFNTLKGYIINKNDLIETDTIEEFNQLLERFDNEKI